MSHTSPVWRLLRIAALWSFPLPFLLAACSPDGEPGAALSSCANGRATIVIEGLDRIARLPAYRAEKEIEFGAILEEEGPKFGLISAVTVDSRGRIYVADTQTHQVWVFSPDGAPAQRVGTEGEGPGEFGGILRAEIGRGDTLYVFDLALWRQVVFDSSGGHVRTVHLPSQPQFGQVPEVAQDDHGRVYALGYDRFRETLLDDLGGRTRAVVRAKNVIERWNPLTKEQMPLLTVPSAEVYFSGSGLRDAPFGRRPLWEVRSRGGGVWYGDTGDYRLAAVDATGDTTCVIRVEGVERPLSDSGRRAYLNASDRENASEDLLRRVRQRRAEMPIPDRRPVLRSLKVTEDGSVWVRVTPEEGAFTGSGTWHVFGPDGVPEARVRLPPDLVVHEVVGSRIYGTRRAEADVQRVVRYRIVRRED